MKKWIKLKLWHWNLAAEVDVDRINRTDERKNGIKCLMKCKWKANDTSSMGFNGLDINFHLVYLPLNAYLDTFFSLFWRELLLFTQDVMEVFLHEIENILLSVLMRMKIIFFLSENWYFFNDEMSKFTTQGLKEKIVENAFRILVPSMKNQGSSTQFDEFNEEF